MQRLLKITDLGAMGAQRAYVATVQYPGEKPSRITFVGPSTSGYPGPAFLVTAKGTQERINDPERFGSTFNREWVRRFFR